MLGTSIAKTKSCINTYKQKTHSLAESQVKTVHKELRIENS